MIYWTLLTLCSLPISLALSQPYPWAPPDYPPTTIENDGVCCLFILEIQKDAFLTTQDQVQSIRRAQDPFVHDWQADQHQQVSDIYPRSWMLYSWTATHIIWQHLSACLSDDNERKQVPSHHQLWYDRIWPARCFPLLQRSARQNRTRVFSLAARLCSQYPRLACSQSIYKSSSRWRRLDRNSVQHGVIWYQTRHEYVPNRW